MMNGEKKNEDMIIYEEQMKGRDRGKRFLN
jgi:hypothetical protein